MDLPLSGRLILAVALAGALSYAVTPVAMLAARRLAFYDLPAGYKSHRAPTPYLGGAAVVLAFTVALLLAVPPAPGRTAYLVGGVAVMFIVGTIDDRRTLSPQLRVAIEFALGVLLSTLGHGWRVGSSPELNAALNGVWVVGVVNAFNLFDNMDGAASTMACVASVGACALGWLHHDAWAVAAGAALCGACLGFLPHNLAGPARIFLGDGGSLPVGFAVAVVVADAARGAEPSVLGLVTGILLVGLPAIDTCLVIVSRRRRGVSILTGGQDHLTHRTIRRVLTARRVALVLGSTQALVSALVIVATREGSVLLVYALLAFLVCAAVVIVGLEQAGSEVAVPGVTASVASVAQERTGRWGRSAGDLAAVALGLGAGLSPLFAAYYDTGVWVPLGLVLTLAAAVGLVTRPPRVTLPAVLSFAGLAALALWSLISTEWAHAVEDATVAADRWLSYAALMLVALVVIRTRRQATLLLLAAGLGIAAVGISVLIRMLGGDPAALFLAGRLNAPLGYINGEGCVFAMGCWFGLALAERRQPLLAGLGVAASVMLACLALLSQSRGTAIASFVAIVVGLLVVPGARRRILALAAVAVGVASAAGSVLRVYSTGQGGVISTSIAHHTAMVILVAAAAAGVIWMVLVALASETERRGPQPAAVLNRGATVLAVLVVAAPLAAVVVRSSDIEHTVRNQWNAFVHLSDTESSSPGAAQTRLFSGAGNRYDYWRVAWRTFTEHPLIGVGAGNYAEYYYRARQTQEAIENPHSLELQTLSELGLVGALVLGVTLVGVVIGARRTRAVARGSQHARTLMLAATGAVVVWFVDTSGDWMHLLPGATAVAIACAAVLCRGGEFVAEPGAPGNIGSALGTRVRAARPSPRALGGAGMVAFVLAIGGASLLRTGLERIYLDKARAALAAHPASAIDDAGKVLRLDGANLDAYYVKAAGQARFDQAAASRATLLSAAREDPEEFVTWTLLGDLEVRLRDFPAAKAFYDRAHALDPNDSTIAALAANPVSALPNPPQNQMRRSRRHVRS